MPTTAITTAITTLAEAEGLFQLQRTENAQFFPEWYQNLLELTETEITALKELRQRYLYQRTASLNELEI